MAFISIEFNNSLYAIRQLDPHMQKNPRLNPIIGYTPATAPAPATPRLSKVQYSEKKLSGVLRSGSVIGIEIDRNDP